MWKVLLGAVLGALAMLAYDEWHDSDAVPAPVASTAGSVTAQDAVGPAASAATPTPLRSTAAMPGERVADDQTTGSGAVGPGPAGVAARASAAAGPLDVPVAPSVPPTGDTRALDELLNSNRLWCQFGPGNGGSWPNGRLFPHDAAWQGGPITLDALDFVGRKAQLKNDSGLTGTQDGELDVSAVATGSSAHFTVVKANGELIVVTVHAALDAERRFPAVVAMHGPGLSHESAQFYGTCMR